MKIAVLISGRGSNLAALIQHQQGYAVEHVISSQADAKGLQVAQAHGIINTFINWSDRDQAEQRLAQLLQELDADLIVLAGFMRILSAQLVEQFSPRLINIHPSLLPKYPGLNTHQKALDNQDRIHGATVHLVNDQLDQGAALAQTRIDIHPADNAETLADRLIVKEHKLLTTIVGLIATGDLQWTLNEVRYQGQVMNQPLMIE